MRLPILAALLALACTPPPTPPSPPPPTTTTTMPAPSPNPEKCDFTQADVDHWENEVKWHDGEQVDLTAVACGPKGAHRPPCNHPDPRRADCCALSYESGNGACQDALYGATWWTPDAGLILINPKTEKVDPQSFTQKVKQGKGFASTCGSIGLGRSCVRLALRAETPPCDIPDPTTGLCQLVQ